MFAFLMDFMELRVEQKETREAATRTKATTKLGTTLTGTYTVYDFVFLKGGGDKRGCLPV